MWFETPIKHLPYNAVIRTRIDGDADAVVAAVVDRFRARGVQFFWLVHPSARPRDLSERLAAQGLESVEKACPWRRSPRAMITRQFRALPSSARSRPLTAAS